MDFVARYIKAGRIVDLLLAAGSGPGSSGNHAIRAKRRCKTSVLTPRLTLTPRTQVAIFLASFFQFVRLHL
jgi:hypothetical protein